MISVCLILIFTAARVREKEKGSFALSISFHGLTKHYKIDKRKTSTGDMIAIEDGPTFDNLMDVCHVVQITLIV